MTGVSYEDFLKEWMKHNCRHEDCDLKFVHRIVDYKEPRYKYLCKFCGREIVKDHPVSCEGCIHSCTGESRNCNRPSVVSFYCLRKGKIFFE